MPYARNHVLLTFLGDAWSGQEEWQFGLRLDDDALPTDAQLQTCIDAYSTFHSNASGFGRVSAGARFLGCKAAVIGTDGKYPEGGQAKEKFRTPLAGGGSNTAPQLTLAVTTTTDVPRGRGSKGRFYMPPPSTTFLAQSDGRVNASDATGYLAGVKTFIQAVNGAGMGPITVFSSFGPANAVTGLRLGRVLDTQRRRRGSLTEEYVTTPLA